MTDRPSRLHLSTPKAPAVAVQAFETIQEAYKRRQTEKMIEAENAGGICMKPCLKPEGAPGFWEIERETQDGTEIVVHYDIEFPKQWDDLPPEGPDVTIWGARLDGFWMDQTNLERFIGAESIDCIRDAILEKHEGGPRY